jgi:hypothetical protein
VIKYRVGSEKAFSSSPRVAKDILSGINEERNSGMAVIGEGYCNGR